MIANEVGSCVICNEPIEIGQEIVEFSSYGIAAEAAALLERIWNENAPADAPRPNFARLVKESNNNVRGALMRLQTELMLAA